MKPDSVSYVADLIDAATYRADRSAANFAKFGEVRAAEALRECTRTLALIRSVVTANESGASESTKHDLIEHRDALGVSAARWQQDLGRFGAHVTSMLTEEQARELVIEYAAEIAAGEEH